MSAAVIDLGVGAPDIPTPPAAAEAAERAIREGLTRYAGAAGIPELREAVADAFAPATGRTVDPDQVVVSAGAKLTLFCVLSALARPGGTVVYPTPHYGGYPHLIRRAGLEGRSVGTSVADGYRIDPSALAAAVDESTVAVMLNTPSNPTGTVYTAEELAELGEIVRARSDAMIVSDEIYARFSYDRPYVSVASLPGFEDRTVAVDGVSKAFGMTGWRIGWAVGPRDLIADARRVNSQMTNCASTISQWAAVGALRGAPSDHLGLASHRRRRDLAYAAAAVLPGAVAVRPGGGIYQAVQLDDATTARLETGGRSVAAALREDHRLRVPEDATFGRRGLLRLTFSVPEPTLAEGLRRLAAALEQH